MDEPRAKTIRVHRPIAFLYPPQPVEPCPMPRDLLQDYPATAESISDALVCLGWEARMRRGALCWSPRPRSVQGMRRAHVGNAAFSWAATQVLVEAGITPDVVFGHSLGLHSALVSTGAAMITDALGVVDRTARFIARPPDGADGAMLAVTGFTPDEIAEHCERAHPPHSIYVAIVNSRRQVVVSGLRETIKACVRCLKRKHAWGLRRLPGRLPLHSPLMDRLIDRCAELVDGARCHVPHVPLIHPTTGEEIRTVSGIERLWRTHLIGHIDFVRCLEAMKRLGVATFIEVGAGDTLTKLGRWFRRELPIFSVGQPGMLERIADGGLE